MLPDGQPVLSITGQNPVVGAIRQASLKTGSDFEYLLTTAMRESGLKPNAKSKSSSAAGLFQFIDQTWLGAIKQFGARYGLGQYAKAIARTARGLYDVASAELREEILALRKDAGLSALMAGETANQAKKALENKLGREVSCGELYVAHFLGQGGACRLIEAYEKDPDAFAASIFPAAAKANRNIFYRADGGAKTVAEVYAALAADPEEPALPPPQLRREPLPSPARPAVRVAQADAPVATATPRNLLAGFNRAAAMEQTAPALAATPAIAARRGDELQEAPTRIDWGRHVAPAAVPRAVPVPAVAVRAAVPNPKPVATDFKVVPARLPAIPQPPLAVTAQMMELFSTFMGTLADEHDGREERPGPLMDATLRRSWEQGSTA